MQETLVRDLKLILEEFRQSFTEIVSNEIEQQEVNVPEGSDLHDLLHRPDLLATIFGTCYSTHNLHKYCQSVLHAIFPTAHELPVSINNKTVAFQYVSILTTLTQILSTGDVLDLIIRKQMTPANSDYFDYTSGSEFNSHPIFSKHGLYLRLHLYIDEFEVVNPLG